MSFFDWACVAVAGTLACVAIGQLIYALGYRAGVRWTMKRIDEKGMVMKP